jgi:phosphoglycolate phosphatase-like HAD superfamily hydrolase
MCTIYVGDTPADLEAASNLGIDFVGVAFGFGFEHSELIFDAKGHVVPIVDSAKQLSHFLLAGDII